MEKIYSKLPIIPAKHLHSIVTLEDFSEKRVDVSEPDQFIQCALLNLNLGDTFKPHIHNVNHREEHYIAQESWVVIRGKVRVSFYDLDGSFICNRLLHQGDASFTYFGGHTYESLAENTLVYEFKTGKYIDQKTDKTFINAK